MHRPLPRRHPRAAKRRGDPVLAAPDCRVGFASSQWRSWFDL